MERILLLKDDIALGQGMAMALQIPNIEIAVCRTLGRPAVRWRRRPLSC